MHNTTCMRRKDTLAVLLIALLLPAGSLPAWAQRRQHGRSNRTMQPEKLEERIGQVRQLAARSTAVSDEVKPLLLLADEFRLEARKKADGARTFSAERLAGASWSVTDAIEMIANARAKNPVRVNPGREHGRDDSSPERDAARELGMAYFRIAQLEFFSRQPGAGRIVELARVSRRLYQEGRAAYDRNDLAAAQQLAAASRELSAAFEKYIQAQLPEELPPPPKVNQE